MTAVTSPALIVGMYEQIKRIREFELKTIGLFQDGIVPGFTHTYVGQEAVAVGMCAPLRKDDRVASNHRGHGHIIAKGADTSRMMAELLGKTEGYCRGMGGEMHIMDPGIGIIGANGIVGAGIPIAVGAALADRLAGRDNVTVVFFGEGATSEGYFAEGLNLAAIWKLAIVFVCENNRYAEFTPSVTTVAGEIARRADGYGIPGVSVDGQDVVAVRDVADEAVERARRGEGPTLIEAKTYRWHGHTYGEEALIGTYKYRTDEEINDWITNRDPLKIARRRVLDDGAATEGELAAIDERVLDEIERAAQFGVNGTDPEPGQALEFLYTTTIAGPGGRR